MAQNNGTQTLTAPRAVIKINGYVSGFMSDINVTENYGRAEVRGIGSPVMKENPITTIAGTLSCGFFFLSLARPEARAFVRRDEGLDPMINTLVLNETPIQVHMYRKIVLTKNADGIVTGIEPEGEVIGIVRDFFVTSQGFNIQEGAVSRMNVSGNYLTPLFTNE